MSQEIIKKYNIGAKKSLGQNFLVDDNKVQEIANTLDIVEKNIIEVGPGYGALTEKLLQKKPNSLHLVELDRDMIDILEDRFFSPSPPAPLPEGEGSFQIFHQDILQFTPEFEHYIVIANIPYYITSPILRHFLYDIPNSPQEMLILMQKDVGDKILGAKTSPSIPLLQGEGSKKRKSSVLSLFIEKKCRVEEKILVSKECFIPVPKIESSVLLFTKHNDFNDVDDQKFLEVIKAGFRSPRKKLIKNLISGGYDREKIIDFFEKRNFSENIRGEDMNIREWIELVKTI